jgi:hypothetical protein
MLFRRATLLCILVSSTTAFQAAPASSSSSAPVSAVSSLPRHRRHQSSSAPLWQYEGGDGGGGGGGGSILLQADAKSRLFESFAALSMADQYDAVLTGLCAKILDGTDKKKNSVDAAVIEALADPMNLLQEMNQKRIQASPRSIMALIDVCVCCSFVCSNGLIMFVCFGFLVDYIVSFATLLRTLCLSRVM